MTDKEILKELQSKKEWWEKRLIELNEEVSKVERELFKVSRMIKLLEEKL